MFTTIQDGNRIAMAQAAFENRIRQATSRSGPITLGYQGGGSEAMVHAIGPLNFWIAFADSGSRYWNAMGIGNPFKDGSTIIVEINPPKDRINLQVSGAYVEDSAGKTYLVHRGKVGGGRKGIGMNAFLAWYPGALVLINDKVRHSKVIVIGALDDEKLIENLAAFTKSVATFKEAVVSGLLKKGQVQQPQPHSAPKPLPPVAANAVISNSERATHLNRFYSILEQLERNIGGRRRLAECSGYMEWPNRGVYFFMEDGETRSDTGMGLRIVRVGTHALKAGTSTTLWTRLSQHQGVTKTGGGNHRGSIFRLIVGTALSAKPGYDFPLWGKGSTASGKVRARELPLEQEVSQVIGRMPFVWIAIEDEARPDSDRGYIERNSISLLSNYNKSPVDPPSPKWLGNFCDRERVRNSGLWNSNHVDEPYDPAFLDRLEELVSDIRPAS